MKPFTSTNKSGLFIFLVIPFLVVFNSCEKSIQDISTPYESPGGMLKTVVEVETPLIAAQNIDAGTVTATFNETGNQLTVTYLLVTSGYCLLETHLDLQADPANFPQTNSGNPKVGQFAYGATLNCEPGWTQVVDLTTIPGWSLGDTVFIAAHAEVNMIPGGVESAWGYGLPFPGNNWAMYFYAVQPAWSCGLPVVDERDGQSYNTVLIGDQCWMAENLNVGSRIDGIEDPVEDSNIEKYCYDNLESNCDIYGGLYKWDEMMGWTTEEGAQGICMEGWHVPTDGEWSVLTNCLGGLSVAGGKMKSIGTIEEGTGLWRTPNYLATNESGFTGFPGGSRIYRTGGFESYHRLGYFWSSSQHSELTAWNRYLYFNYVKIIRTFYDKRWGWSVRCVNDE